jgi:hypothetical protein
MHGPRSTHRRYEKYLQNLRWGVWCFPRVGGRLMFTSKLNTGREVVRFRIKTSTYVSVSMLTAQAQWTGPELYAEIKTNLLWNVTTCGLIINYRQESIASLFMKKCASILKMETVFFTRLHGIVSRKMIFFIVTVCRIYDPHVSTSVRPMGL